MLNTQIFWLGFAVAALFCLAISTLIIGYLYLRLRRRKFEQASVEAGWTQALDFAEDAMYLVDLDDNLVRANQIFYQHIGLTPERAVGRNVRNLIHGKHAQEFCPVCEARRLRRDTVITKEADDPTNRLKRPMEAIVKIIRDEQDVPLAVLHIVRDLSRQRAAQDALRESEERFRRLSEVAFEGILIHEKGTIIDANQTISSLSGYELSEIIGSNILKLVSKFSRDMAVDRIRNMGDDPFEIEVLRKDGRIVLAEVQGKNVMHQGRPIRVVAVRDISELKRTKEALFQEKERLMVTLASIGEAVITTDVQGCVQYLNPVAERLTGWGDHETHGLALSEVFRVVDEATGDYAQDPVRHCLHEDRIVTSSSDNILRRRDEKEFAIEYSTAPIRDRDGDVIGAILVFRDVTEMRSMARQLTYQASHDALTGLINRHEFENRLKIAMRNAVSFGNRHTLCYLDLDQFKVVNDTCGHVAGDQLLKHLAVLLKTRLRDSDTLARLGGDEFGVLLENCPLAKAREIAEGLREVIRGFRFVWQNKTFDVGVSIGLAPMTADSGSVAEVLSAADAACYVAKDMGRNRVHVYQPDDLALAKQHGEMEWAQRIARAVESQQLRLYCQPIVPLGKELAPVTRYEILVRMLDAQQKLVLPMAFIPAAERYNVMPAVDRWVIHATLTAMSETRYVVGREDMLFSINISGRSLCDDRFLGFVVEEIKRSGVSARRLCFEITETAAIANFAQAQRFIASLKSMGCFFALDDFGSGLSSFSYLKNLPIDYLKIDGSFVRDLAHDPIDYAMVESINQLGHVMDIQTVAEYVETDAVMEKLKRLGVDYVQGYAVAEPLPLEQLFVSPQDLAAVESVNS